MAVAYLVGPLGFCVRWPCLRALSRVDFTPLSLPETAPPLLPLHCWEHRFQGHYMEGANPLAVLQQGHYMEGGSTSTSFGWLGKLQQAVDVVLTVF